MLADFVGSDLSRLTGELEKLIITLPTGQKRVTPEQIEKKDVYKRQVRYNTGLVAKLDVAQAKSVLYSTKASIPQLERCV